MKDILIIANLKMTMVRRRDVVVYCDHLRKHISTVRNLKQGVKLVVCPSAPHYDVVARAVHVEPRIAVGAQNAFWEQRGSYTGQISPITLSDSEVTYVLIGHSEQRAYGHITDSEIAQQAEALLRAEIVPVIFVGETAQERENGRMKDVLTVRMRTITRSIRAEDINRCVFVYEPVWAVGAQNPPLAEEIMTARILLQKILAEVYDARFAQTVQFLYGGSVTPENAILFTPEVGMRGVVLGRAGTNDQSFVQIASTVAQNFKK